MPTTAPHFRELSPDECRALLIKHNVGWIAFTRNDRVDIEPINYVSDGEWIFGRTGAGAKLTTLLHHPWCAHDAGLREVGHVSQGAPESLGQLMHRHGESGSKVLIGEC